jgi:hypothetical protein
VAPSLARDSRVAEGARPALSPSGTGWQMVQDPSPQPRHSKQARLRAADLALTQALALTLALALALTLTLAPARAEVNCKWTAQQEGAAHAPSVRFTSAGREASCAPSGAG